MLIKVGPFHFGYDAVGTTKKRRNSRPSSLSEDEELRQEQRRELLSGARDLSRNFALAGWAIRKHLDYVSTFQFQARTGNSELDAQLERFVDRKSRPGYFDAAGRHPLRRYVRMQEERAVIDGDMVTSFISNGTAQAIEGDRIKTPTDMPTGFDPQKIVNGVVLDDYGKTRGYMVCKRVRGGGMVFDRFVPAAFAHQRAYWSRFDQVRGISPLAPAINMFCDLYESFDYALAKAKVSQLFALAFYREAADVADIAPITSETDEAGSETGKYSIDFGKGPVQLDLDPGDRAEFLESKNPSSESQAFWNEMISIALKALDIPVSFYDEGRANFSSGRQAWILYDQSATSKREDNREFLDRWTLWRLGLGMVDGEITLPRSVKWSDVNWQWVHKGIPWIDPLKEITADIAAVNSGLTSPQRLAANNGEDAFEILDEIAKWQKYAREHPDGPIQLSQTLPTVVVSPQENANANGN